MTEPVVAPVRTRRTWDVALTVVLLVLYLGGVLLGSGSSFFLAFAGDSCGASSVCNYDQIANGMMIVLVGPWVPVIFVLGGAILLLVTKRLAFWLPLVGGALTIAIVVVGWMVATSGVQPA